MSKWKEELYILTNDDLTINKKKNIFDAIITALILLNIVILVLNTFTLSEEIQKIINILEISTVIVFSLEYILRLWSAPKHYPNISPLKARIKFIFSLMAVIDLLAILPFYLYLFTPINLSALGTLRILRIFRLFRLQSFMSPMYTIVKVFQNKSKQLLSSIFIVFIMMFISSLLMYHVENPVQPDVFKNGLSGLWWAVETFTTVGYGDIIPITPFGKLLGSIIALLGIGIVAVPTGIITSGFLENFDENKKEKKFCPHCGENIED